MPTEAIVLGGTVALVAAFVVLGTRRSRRDDQVTDYKQRNGWEQ